MPISGLRTTGRHATNPPRAAIHSVVVTTSHPPSTPPISPPSGMVPKTMNRTEAFIRPSRRGGQSRSRKLIWVTL